jgi:hypothetical protein
VLTGDTPDVLTQKIRAHWQAMQMMPGNRAALWLVPDEPDQVKPGGPGTGPSQTQDWSRSHSAFAGSRS